MYISLLKELYDQDNRLTNSYMEGEFQTKSPKPITTDNFSYINRDLVGTKQELVKYEALPEEIIFDTSARSYVYDFNVTKEIRAIELYPESKVHRVRERDVHIYVKKSNEDAWVEVRNWKFNKDEKNGKLSFVFTKAVSAGYVKVRSVWDDRNVENESIDDYSTFKGNANNLLRIWTLENTLTEEFSYDGNSNRIRKAENGTASSYEYYKNTQGGNTAKVKYDGKWYYTYDANGNRTEKAKALISGVADKNKEYWTYEWDLWNRLVKVVQYNAPDNGECVEVSYEYDALNHRISRTSGTETTKYAYGRNGALAYQEKTKDGKIKKRSFAYLNNEIVGFTDKVGEEESVYYTVTDIQGSITEVYDGSSNIVWKSGYTAFGELAGETVDLIDFDGMYTGCDYDAETGLTYHWNRWRSEDGSAFISEDPVRDGANWYGYAGQNPMVYVDRIGLFYYTAEGQQSSTSNTPKTDKNNNSNKTPQNQGQNITGQGGNQTVIPEVETDFISEIWDYVPSLLDLKDDWKKTVVSVFVTYIDNQLDKAIQREKNGDYEGSLYFQQYITQVEAHNEADGLMTILSFVPEPSFSGALTVVGFLHNFEKRDGMLIHGNITGFIKGAEQEIVRINEILDTCNNEEFREFLFTQKDYLDKEIKQNKNHFYSNISYSNIYGSPVDIDKNEKIGSSVPLPGIKYKERFLQGGTI